MSDLKKQLDRDINTFFENIENQSFDDQKKTLKNMFDKFLHLNTSKYIMDKHDLRSIVGYSKTLYSHERMPMHLGLARTPVEQDELKHICIIESTISHLNNKGCLKRLPKFDKRDDTLE